MDFKSYFAKLKSMFGWGNRKYTREEIETLLVKIDDFKCGAIDPYLTKHITNVFEEWVKELN